ncbi:MAG: hypothetical protein Pars2KO_10920 [Parasphingorhabdus sp.]
MTGNTISVELCGRLADPCGPVVDLPLPAGEVGVLELLSSLGTHFPPLKPSLDTGRIRACINETVVYDDVMIGLDDVVALFPPVSGG